MGVDPWYLSKKRKHADITADALHYISNVIIDADDKNLVRIDLQF